MCMQSKSIDRATVSGRPETDPLKQTGKSALVNSTHTEKQEHIMGTITVPNKKGYRRSNPNNGLSIYVPDTYENSSQLRTNCFGAQFFFFSKPENLKIIYSIELFQVVNQFKYQNWAEFTKAMPHNVLQQPMRSSSLKFRWSNISHFCSASKERKHWFAYLH